MSDNDDFPQYEKTRRNVRIDEPIDRYIQENTANVSGTVNRILWDAIGGEIPEEGPEYETPNLRKRVLKLQLEALKKERHELQMMEERLQGALDRMEDEPKRVWMERLDRALKGHKHPRWSRSEMIEETDPDPDEAG